MKLAISHRWDLTPTEAIALQKQLCKKVIREDQLNKVQHVAGVDVGFENRNRITRAAVAVLQFPELELVDQGIARIPTQFPYVPGLLSFREIPAILKAFDQLHIQPDLLLCDGQGIAHPRRLGLASHLGIITDLPSIGVAKTRLTGTHEEVPNERGKWQPLYDQNEVIGAVLRTRVNVKPLYISTGHRISLEKAIQYVMNCTTRYRLPETTRWAHRLASGPVNR